MARKGRQQAPLRTRSGIVLDDKKVEELVREIVDDATEWSEPLPKSQWPVRGRGRPSLTGESQHSPRVPNEFADAVQQRLVHLGYPVRRASQNPLTMPY